MEHANKYEKSYFLPPVCTYDWVKKDAITAPPIWCSVDLRDGNQALIEPMSLDEKLHFLRCLWRLVLRRLKWAFLRHRRQNMSLCAL